MRGEVWDCEGSKNLGSDEYNFYFIKKFWTILKKTQLIFIFMAYVSGQKVVMFLS